MNRFAALYAALAATLMLCGEFSCMLLRDARCCPAVMHRAHSSSCTVDAQAQQQTHAASCTGPLLMPKQLHKWLHTVTAPAGGTFGLIARTSYYYLLFWGSLGH